VFGIKTKKYAGNRHGVLKIEAVKQSVLALLGHPVHRLCCRQDPVIVSVTSTCSSDGVDKFLPHDAMQARSLLSCSVCPSVCHVRGSRQNE